MMSGMAVAKSVILLCCSCQMIFIVLLQFLRAEKEMEYGVLKSEQLHTTAHARLRNDSVDLRISEWQRGRNMSSKMPLAGRNQTSDSDYNKGPTRISNVSRTPWTNTSTWSINVQTEMRFTFILDEPSICGDEDTKPPYLLVQVHSHFTHKPQRDAIRDTWGRISRDFDRDKQVRLVFLVGRDVSKSTLPDKLIHESTLYRDIIAGDFVDTYRNLTLKSLAGLYWATRYCSNAAFLLKADDDMFLNVSNILSVINSVQIGNDILGALNTNSSVVRKGLWAVDERAFPGKTYPPYCAGNTYVMKTKTARRLLAAVPKARMLPIEDVYVTGILAQLTGSTCQGHPGFPHWYVGPSPKHLCSLLTNKLYGIHNVQYEQMYRIFQKVQRRHYCD